MHDEKLQVDEECNQIHSLLMENMNDYDGHLETLANEVNAMSISLSAIDEERQHERDINMQMQQSLQEIVNLYESDLRDIIDELFEVKDELEAETKKHNIETAARLEVEQQLEEMKTKIGMVSCIYFFLFIHYLIHLILIHHVTA